MTELQAHLDRLVIEPADASALEAIEGAYRGDGRWEELLRIYEDNALRVNGDRAGPLWRKAASICLTELASPPRAEAYLQRAIETQPTDVESLRALRELYLGRGEYERGAEVFEREIARIEDGSEKSALQIDLAKIYIEQLDRAEKALATLRQASRHAPKNLDVYRLMATVYELQGRNDAALKTVVKELGQGGPDGDVLDRVTLVAERLIDRPKLHDQVREAVAAVLEHRDDDSAATRIVQELDDFENNWKSRAERLTERAAQEGISDKARASELWLSVAEIQLVYGDDHEAALSSIDKALAGRPGHPTALKLLEEIYGQEGRFDDLALKLEMMAAYTRDTKVSVELYLKAALHHSVRLDDQDASARIYQRVLELDPGNKVASNALVEYYRERKRWDEALGVLKEWAARTEQASDKVAAYYGACRILEEEKGDHAAARPFYEAILELDPNNQAAARALERVYRESGAHAELAKTLRAKLAGISDFERRRPVLEELGELYAGPLDDARLGLSMFGELYSSNPTAALRERLEELAARSGAFVELVRFLESGLEKISADGERVDALHSLAALYEGARDAPLEALRVHRRILGIAPQDERARAAVDRLLLAAAETTDKVSFYQEQAQAAQSPEERRSILMRLGEELVQGTKDYARAIDVYREILRGDPGNSDALDQLIALYQRDNRWPEVADLLAQKIESTEGSERDAIAFQLGEITETRLGDFERAADWYGAILSRDSSHEEALLGLERLLPKIKQLLRVAELLQPIYVERDRWDRAAAMLEVRVKECEDPVERAEMLRELAAMYSERLGQPDQALGALLRAFQSNPADQALQVDLETIARSVGEFGGVIRAYRAAALMLEPPQQFRLILRAAGLSEAAGDLSGAMVDYLRVLAASHTDDDPVLENISRVVRGGADIGHLLTSASKIAEGLEDAAKVAFWRTLARFLESEDRPRDAISAWRMVLDVQENDSEASREIDRLFDNAAEPSELAEHLRSKLSSASEDGEIRTLANQLADLLVERLGDPGAAALELAAAAERAPGQLQLWQRLAATRLELNDPVAAAEAMHKEINLMPDTAERRSRLLDYAELALEHLDDRAGALHALQGVVAVEPANGKAVDLLKQLYAKASDLQAQDEVARILLPGLGATEQWTEAVQVLTQLVEGRQSVEERVALSKEIASIQSNQLRDPAAAYSALERAFREAPLDEELRLQLEQFAETANEWEALAGAYYSAIAVVEDPDQQRPLRRKLAEVLDQRLGRGEEAIEHYRAITGGALPDDLPSLEAMERLLRGQEQPSELAEVLGAIAQKLDEKEVARKKEVLSELAQLAAGPLGDQARAIGVLKQLIALDERNPDALHQLDTLLESLDQHDARIGVLTSLAELGAHNPEVVEDLIKLAQVMVSLQRYDEALQHFRAALMKKRDHEGAIQGLEALIMAAPNKLEIAQVLEPVYTGRQNHEKLAWVLGQKLEVTEELPQRKALLRRIGDIYENRLDQKDRAFAMARRSLSEDPSDMGVRMWIEKLAGETGALAELASAYVEEAERAEDALALQFHRRAASIFHEKIQDTAAAVQEYRAILQVEGRDEKALSGLEAIFRQTEAHEDLVGLLRLRLENTAGMERKREYITEIASLQATQLGDLEGAIASTLQLLEITPEDPQAIARVEELYRSVGKFDELVQFYQNQFDRLAEKRGKESTARRVEYLFRKGRILDEQFSDYEGAIDAFSRALDEFPRHPGTIEYLEERAGSGAMHAILLLEKVYHDLGEWQKYVELLENKLQYTPETDRRREIYLAMSTSYVEHLNAGDMGFIALTRAYNENRADMDLLDRLESLSEKLNNWDELVEVVGVDVDALPDPTQRQSLLLRLGTISGQKLGDIDQAVRYLEGALQYNPRDEKALSMLDSLLEQNERWAALADLLERRIELADEARDKSALLERLAIIWGERLQDAEAALRCHQQILEIDPDHPLTLKSMQKLYAELEDWDSLAENLARQSLVLSEAEDQVRIHSAAGELYAEELNDYGLAIESWLKVVEHQPSHEEANQALNMLLTVEERWSELADHYQRQLKHTQSPSEKADLNQRLGVILGEKLGRGEEALESWLEVVETEPRNIDALRALLGLYAERAMWEEYVDIARRLIPIADPSEAKDVRFKLARALGENLGQRDEAVRLAREVRATEPHTAEFMNGLARMLVNIEAWDEAVIALEKAGSLEEDDEAAIERYRDAARIYREQLTKPNDARSAYQAIRELKPQDIDAYLELAEVYRNTGEWRRLVALNEDVVPHADPELRLRVLTEIRDVQDDKLGEKELAFIAACRVYKENPADLEAANVIERIALETDGAEEAAAVLEDELDAVVDPDIKIALYRQLARIYTEHMQDYPEAEQALNSILQIEPSDIEALDSLTALGAIEERPDKQLNALETKLVHVVEDLDRKRILFDIARIWEDQIGESDEAIGAFNRVLEIDGADLSALNALARIYADEEKWTELAHTLTRKVELSEDVTENIKLRMQVASLCEGELEDPEAAIQWYRGVLDFESGNEAALASLERLYTSLERWSELVQIYEVQLAHTEDAEAQVHILNKEASIYESEFESPRDATACYERVLQIDGGNMAGIRNLERLLRSLGEWNRLIEILQHHITLLEDNEEITELYLQIGEVYYRELSRVDKAEEIYNLARDFNPESGAALKALGQLYERSGNWFQSLDMLQKEADAFGNDRKALPTLLRIGRINDEMLMDLGAAQSAYQRALEIDPNYGPALSALKEIAKSNEDWDAYSEYLIAEAESSDDAEEKTELFAEAARFHAEVRDDEAAAIRYFQRALEITPEHIETARALAEIYFRHEAWEEASELYQLVVQDLDKSRDAKDYCQKHYRLGYIHEKLGDKDTALNHYREAFDADATYLPALEGLGQALLSVEEWEEAQKVFQTVLIHHRESLTESEIVDVQWQIGDVMLRQDQPDRAYKQFEKALEIDPDHAPSLRALAELDERMENWDGAYDKLSRLADAVAGHERGEVLMRLSDIARDRLSDSGRAVEALERARRMGAPPIAILLRLADSYLGSHQHQKAFEVLEQAAEVAEEPPVVSDVNFRLAQVLESHIKNDPMALQRYNAALDANPQNVPAFEAVEQLLVRNKQWGLLEQNYREMLVRTKGFNPQFRLVLWRNLAELYRRVLNSVDNAIAAYEAIIKLDPGKSDDLAVLAELYAEKPEHRAKAIQMLHDLIPTLENPVDVVRKLRKLYHANRQFDEVYMMASSLVCLKVANEEEVQVFNYLKQGVPARATQGLPDEAWAEVTRRGVAGPIASMAAALYRGAPDAVTHVAKDLGLARKQLVDVRSSDLYFANIIRYAAKVLNIPPVDFYRKAGSMEALQLAPAQPPALVVGENNDAYRETNQRLAVFNVGRMMAYARPELFLARVYPGADLRNLLFGICLVFNRSLQHSGEPREVERWLGVFERLPQTALRRLQAPAQSCYTALTQGTALQDYQTGVELTALRAGLVACGDLSAALAGAARADGGAAAIPVQRRAQELVRFATSLSYLRLRKAIGGALVAQEGQ